MEASTNNSTRPGCQASPGSRDPARASGGTDGATRGGQPGRPPRGFLISAVHAGFSASWDARYVKAGRETTPSRRSHLFSSFLSSLPWLPCFKGATATTPLVSSTSYPLLGSNLPPPFCRVPSHLARASCNSPVATRPSLIRHLSYADSSCVIIARLCWITYRGQRASKFLKLIQPPIPRPWPSHSRRYGFFLFCFTCRITAALPLFSHRFLFEVQRVSADSVGARYPQVPQPANFFGGLHTSPPNRCWFQPFLLIRRHGGEAAKGAARGGEKPWSAGDDGQRRPRRRRGVRPVDGVAVQAAHHLGASRRRLPSHVSALDFFSSS